MSEPSTSQANLPDAAGPVMLRLAREAIEAGLADRQPPEPQGEGFLDEPGAVFVTLTQRGSLRGCIGSLEPHRPLGRDVQQNAQAAAFGDPRFSPLRPEELDFTQIEVSVLSKEEPINFTDRADLLEQLRPGIDGLVVQAAGRRATFLPQVWDQLPHKGQFVSHLLRKAGLPDTYWGPDVRVWRYTVQAFEEPATDATVDDAAAPAPTE
ncbi:MAG: AmmeMemoRadiSam system protein A [Bifidobacteriaceae bacterium]|jgi:AmmeMemoRadiSam system protein A|nr:AmmeMemoRadiSam system protein A [Bifidobacteriaceae bacterium]